MIRLSQRGFTLIEMLLALSVFSLIMLVAYQALGASAKAKLRVSQSIDQQSQLRSAHRTLSNALDSRAAINGGRFRLELDMSVADSPWLAGANSVRFEIDKDGSLTAYIDNNQASLLIETLDQPQFRYFTNDATRSSWAQSDRPSAVEFSWVEHGEVRRWRFNTR